MRRALALLVFLLALPCAVYGQVSPAPSTITYQGRLTTGSGTPAPDGSYSIGFSLWTALTGGTELWNETINPVQVTGGVFSVTLDVSTPANLFSGDLWLQVQVGTDPPLSPRTPLTSVPYALKANTVPDGSITAGKLAPGVLSFSNITGQVTSSQISPAVFSSLPLPLISPGFGVQGTAAYPGSYATAIATDGHYAYVVFWSSNLLGIFDVSNPLLPVLVGQIGTASQPQGIAYGAGHVYVASRGAGLQVFDVTNPAAPVLAGQVSGSGWSVAADGHYAYTVDFTGTGNTFYIYDVSNPASPTLVGHTSVNLGFSTIAVVGNTAYFTMDSSYGGVNRLLIYDVTDRTNPTYLAQVNLSSVPRCIAAEGSYVYVGVGNGTSDSYVRIYNVTAPSQPTLAGSYPLAGIPSSVALSGTTLCVSTSNYPSPYMLYMLNVTNRQTPYVLDWVNMPDYSGGQVAASGSRLCVAGNANLRVMALAGEESPATFKAVGSLVVDNDNQNDGDTTNALLFGQASGEGIASKRTASGNQYGLDFYTGFQPRMMITNSGLVGIGTTGLPSHTLEVNGSVAGVGNYVNMSDGRFKKDITPIHSALGTVEKLKGVSFQWDRSKSKTLRFPQGKQLGLIAQQVEEVAPEVVSTAPNGIKSIAYSELVPVLIEAVKEQQKEITAQYAQIERLKKLEWRLAAIERVRKAR